MPKGSLEGKKGLFFQLMDSAYAATGIGDVPAHRPVSPRMQKLYDEEIAKHEQRMLARKITAPREGIGEFTAPQRYSRSDIDFRSPSELGIGPSEDWKRRDDARMERLAESIGAPTTPANKPEVSTAYLTQSGSQIAAMRREDPEAAQKARDYVREADNNIWRSFVTYRDEERKAGRWDGSGPIDLRNGEPKAP